MTTMQSRRWTGIALVAALVLAPLLATRAHALTAQANVPAAQSGTTVTALAAGGYQTCAVLAGGGLKCWGDNTWGQLGLGDTTARGKLPRQMGDYLVRVELGTRKTARAVGAGAGFACALLTNGSVRCFGTNTFSQLGHPLDTSMGDSATETGSNLPTVNLGTGRKAKALGLSYQHACALLDNSTVKCWGGNNQGQLGYGDTNNRGDDPTEMGNTLPTVGFGTGRKARAIAVGGFHTCALLDNSTVKCWGSNLAGQLGYGDTLNRGDNPGEMGNALPAVNFGTGRKAKAISAGSVHTCAILDNNTVKCWGSNLAGQLGYGDTNTRGDTATEMGNALPAVNLGTGRKAKAIWSGGVHTCALLDNNTVKCWGDNTAGQLGYGDTNNRGDNPGELGDALAAVNLGVGRTAKSIAPGIFHTCALLDNNTVKCWGDNTAGQLGYGDTNNRGDNPGELGDALAAVNLGVRVRAIGGYNAHSCAVLENRSLQCWGENGDGQLGYGDTLKRGDSAAEMGNGLPAVDLGTARTVTALADGHQAKHTCAILDNGTLKCWGRNTSGQLGYGDTNDRGDNSGEMGNNLPAVNLGTGRSARSVTLGIDFTCAILDNGTVKCWGANYLGMLGQGDTADRGDGPNEMGNNLATVNLGTGRKAKAISAGYEHVCALLDNNTVKCWGNNAEGELGLGDTNTRGNNPNEMGNNLPAIDLGAGRRARAIAAGGYHTCALLDNGTVKCWGGNNFSGQLGYGDTLSRADKPGEMGNTLEPVDLGTGRRATALAISDAFTCALLDNGSVKCWGQNAEGQLGYSDTRNRGDSDDEMGDFLPAIQLGGSRRVISVRTGGAHVCALLDDRSVRCWGGNDVGQLGYGDMNNRGNSPGEMGSALKPVALTG